MMQLCVCKEGGRRNRGGNRSRSLGHQPAVEPATLPPTAPSSLILFLHPSTPFIPPVQYVTSLRTSRRSLQPASRVALPSSSSNNVNSRVTDNAVSSCNYICLLSVSWMLLLLPSTLALITLEGNMFLRVDFAYDEYSHFICIFAKQSI